MKKDVKNELLEKDLDEVIGGLAHSEFVDSGEAEKAEKKERIMKGAQEIPSILKSTGTPSILA